MKRGKRSLLLLAALLVLFVIASRAEAQPFILSKVVDTNTPIPGGSGNFSVFSYGFLPPYMVNGGNVAFQAGGESGQFGIYLFNRTTLSTVADTNTPVPDDSENFIGFFSDYPAISNNNVAFYGASGSGREGIYLFNGTSLSKVADTNTPIPAGVGNFSYFSAPVISGVNVTFHGWRESGEDGIYLFNGTLLSKVADTNTPVPAGSGNFDYFSDPVMSGGNVAFQGVQYSGQEGIYLFNGTSLSKVADTNTPIPAGSGNFVYFSAPVISGVNVTFHGWRESGGEGIYLFNGTILSKVADTNTPIPGGSGNFDYFSDPVMSGGKVAFQGFQYSGQEGIYLFNGTSLSKVADTNTPIPGGSGNFAYFSAPVISGGNVALHGWAESGEDGIYLFNGTTLSKVADFNTSIPAGSGNFDGFFDPVIDDGKIVFGAAGGGLQGFYLAIPQARPADFDGDGRTDNTIWRPGDGYWHTINSNGGSVTSRQWGLGALNDIPVAGDFDGDGKTDYAVWRPGNGFWYIISSKDGSITSQQWGTGSLNDVPVPGDYDGDGKTDIAVWRPGEGYWHVITSKDGTITSQQWGSGALNDKPVPGDYDGDGKTDYAVWRPGDGFWYILKSSDGGVIQTQWGSNVLNDVLVPGDYDGDGKTDIAVWRPNEGFWYIISSRDGSIVTQQWGAGYAPYNDVPVPGDYDGDGKTDIAIWRRANGYWYILNSKDGSITATQWGAGYAPYNDEPILQ